LRRDHHGDPRGAGVLLRRGLPPAVPREEPSRVLPGPLHRRELPGRPRGVAEEGSATMEVKELGHIVLYVRDLEVSRGFYRDVLGWHEIGSQGGMMAMYSSGRTHHEL